MIEFGIYKHYKGGHYNIISVAKHSETLEDLVIYQRLYDDFSIWVRPITMFSETVSYNGATVIRFEYLGNKEILQSL